MSEGIPYINTPQFIIDTSYKINTSVLPGFEDAPTSKSQHYAFIRGPQELSGGRVDDITTQKIILEWLERERERGHKLVGSFDTSLVWLFEVLPNSVRFIKDDWRKIWQNRYRQTKAYRWGFNFNWKNLSENILANGSILNNDIGRENIINNLISIYKDLENKRLIPPIDVSKIDVDIGREKVYKVTFKDQLNSIHFITDAEDVRYVYYTARSDFEAREIAEKRLSKSSIILDIEMDHYEIHPTLLNVSFSIPIFAHYIKI